MLRPYLVLLFAGACVPAQATLLRVDYDFQTAPIGNGANWLLADPMPSSVQVSFTIDTSSATFTDLTLKPPGDSSSCLLHPDFQGLALSDISATSTSMSFGADTTSSNGRFGGSLANACPGSLFGYILFSTSDLIFVGEVDFANLSAAQVASSADPLADLLANAVPALTFIGTMEGAWGKFYISGNGTIHEVRDVPEPSVLMLFAAGFLGLFVRRKVRR